MKNWYNIAKAQTGNAAEVMVYDAIGAFGISAAQFAADLKALGNVDQLTLRINSPGGSIVDGTAIFNLLRAHSAVKTVYIDGIAASMASVLAMVGDQIIMPENALMMIHNPWTVAMGDAEQLRKDADLLDKMKGQILGAYAARTGKSEADISALMDAETWMTGTEALAAGFATATCEPLKMAAAVDLSAFAKVDPRAASLFASKSAEAENKNEREPVAASPTVEQQPPVGATGDLVARHEAELATRENLILQLRADLDTTLNSLAALTTERDGLNARLSAETNAHTGTRQLLEQMKARHEKMFAGLHYKPEGTTDKPWEALVAEHGYEKARKEFPEQFRAYMKSKGINFK